MTSPSLTSHLHLYVLIYFHSSVLSIRLCTIYNKYLYSQLFDILFCYFFAITFILYRVLPKNHIMLLPLSSKLIYLGCFAIFKKYPCSHGVRIFWVVFFLWTEERIIIVCFPDRYLPVIDRSATSEVLQNSRANSRSISRKSLMNLIEMKWKRGKR